MEVKIENKTTATMALSLVLLYAGKKVTQTLQNSSMLNVKNFAFRTCQIDSWIGNAQWSSPERSKFPGLGDRTPTTQGWKGIYIVGFYYDIFCLKGLGKTHDDNPLYGFFQNFSFFLILIMYSLFAFLSLLKNVPSVSLNVFSLTLLTFSF